MPRLASIRQPNGQELHWTQPPALRLIGPPLAPRAARALHRQLPVAAHPLGVERRDPQELLRLPVLVVEVGRPVDPGLGPPALEHLGRGAEAGAGVDHRRPPDRPADRDRHRRPSLGDGQPGIAVEAGDRVDRVAAGSWRGRSGRPASSTTTSRPASASDRRRGRASRAGADDRDVARLAVRRSLGVAQRPGRLGARCRRRARRRPGSRPAPGPRGGSRSRACRAPWPSAGGRDGGRSGSPPSARGSPRGSRGRAG